MQIKTQTKTRIYPEKDDFFVTAQDLLTLICKDFVVVVKAVYS